MPGDKTCDTHERIFQGVIDRGVTIHGCHLTHSTWRQTQEFELVQQYTADPDFRLFCGMVGGLAFFLSVQK